MRRARARAHGGGACLVEGREELAAGRRRRHRRGGQLFRGVVGAVAGDAGRRGLGRARGWGRADPRRAPYRSTRGEALRRAVRAGREHAQGRRSRVPRSAGSNAAAARTGRRRGCDGRARALSRRAVAQSDAGWAPVRMHHRPTRDPPRALAVDPGGRLVSGFHDGSLTCATLPDGGDDSEATRERKSTCYVL